MEEWRDVSGYEGRYQVSNLGAVRSFVLSNKGRILNPSLHSAGYPQVTLCDISKSRKTVAVHRLILRAFVGPPPKGMEGCHNDGDPTNCRLSNLRYDTHRSNVADQQKHGTHRKGERNGRAKLTAAQVSEIRARRRRGDLLRVLASDYGVALATIHTVTSGSSWREAA